MDNLDAQHRFVDHCFQLKMNARTLIQAKVIDGFTIQSLKFNFTRIADIKATDDVDAKIGKLTYKFSLQHLYTACIHTNIKH